LVLSPAPARDKTKHHERQQADHDHGEHRQADKREAVLPHGATPAHRRYARISRSYPSRTCGAAKAQISAATAMNVPNGMRVAMPRRVTSNAPPPMMTPSTHAIMRVSQTSGHPRKAPTIASILKSPIPMPSRPRTRAYSDATANGNNPPISTP